MFNTSAACWSLIEKCHRSRNHPRRWRVAPLVSQENRSFKQGTLLKNTKVRVKQCFFHHANLANHNLGYLPVQSAKKKRNYLLVYQISSDKLPEIIIILGSLPCWRLFCGCSCLGGKKQEPTPDSDFLRNHDFIVTIGDNMLQQDVAYSGKKSRKLSP